MRVFKIVFFALLSVNCFSQSTLKKADKFVKLISEENLRKNLTYLAGPETQGRETATEGQRMAAAYIETQMKSAGLLPAANGSFQMPFPVYRDSVTSAALQIGNKALSWKSDFAAPASNFPSKLAFSELIYVNFSDSAWKQSKIDVTGKLVLFAVAKPKTGQGFNMTGSYVSSVMKRGAAAALVVDSSLKQELLSDMAYSEIPSRQTINYFLISPEVAESILAAGFDSTRLPAKVYKADVSMAYDETKAKLQSTNVVGYIEGKSKKDEFLVISAHHDHLGKRDSVIWYGADDDGSGTVSLLELAKVFAAAKAAGNGPERSILFLSVSGEEKGLWGSRYYSEHPLFALDKTTADLNIDMVGRVDSAHIDSGAYVYVIGDDRLSTDLLTITEMANAKANIKLDRKYNDPKDPNRFYFRSDHYNFAQKGVPVIFYFNGVHADYHRPTDTVDKINFEMMAKRVKLVFYTAWEMANRPSMLARDKPMTK